MANAAQLAVLGPTHGEQDADPFRRLFEVADALKSGNGVSPRLGVFAVEHGDEAFSLRRDVEGGQAHIGDFPRRPEPGLAGANGIVRHGPGRRYHLAVSGIEEALRVDQRDQCPPLAETCHFTDSDGLPGWNWATKISYLPVTANEKASHLPSGDTEPA